MPLPIPATLLRSSALSLLVVLLLAPTVHAAPDTDPAPTAAVETILQSRNKVMLELGGQPVLLEMSVRSLETGRRLQGEVTFKLVADAPLEATDELTCAPSLSLRCGIVTRFGGPRTQAAPPVVFEALLEDNAFRILQNSKPAAQPEGRPGARPASGDTFAADAVEAFETFIQNLVGSASVAVKVRVDQKEEFLFDLRGLPWPLAEFSPHHPFTKRFLNDPVLDGLKRRYPARYLRILDVARKVSPETGTLSPESEVKILDAMHAEVASLRPLVSDDLLEKIVVNADAAAREVGDRDLALCNALAVAARSAVTTPLLQGTRVAKEEYELWRQIVEQSHPRFIRKVPNEALQPSSDRFEDNMRRANESGCGMFAAVIEAILKLPPEERRLWLRATVGTVEDLRAQPAPAKP
jgi:hypothetical protein